MFSGREIIKHFFHQYFSVQKSSLSHALPRMTNTFRSFLHVDKKDSACKCHVFLCCSSFVRCLALHRLLFVHIVSFSWKCIGEEMVSLYDKATKSDPIIVSDIH